MAYLDLWRQLIPSSHWAEDDPVLNAVYAALAAQADDLVNAIRAAVSYLSPATADSDVISRWEGLLGIGSDGDLTTRIARVRSRLLGYGTIRPETYVQIAQTFGSVATVVEDAPNYRITVTLQDHRGDAAFAAELMAVYAEITRASILVELVNTLTWAELAAMLLTWDDLAHLNITWADLPNLDPNAPIERSYIGPLLVNE